MADWQELEKQCLLCEKCELCKTRNNVVFGVGVKNAEVLFIGEGPGEQEDLMGEPFVGPAGKLLDDMLKIIDLSRHENVYIANIVKCRPPQNRDPKPDEQAACIDWLRGQFSLLRPRIVVCLGRIAAKALIDDDFKITKQHGKWFDKNGVKYFVLYHPSALLRDPSKRPETFVDLKELQRGIRDICRHTYKLY